MKINEKSNAGEWPETMGKHGNYVLPMDIYADTPGKSQNRRKAPGNENINKWKKN